MNLEFLYGKALKRENLNVEEGMFLYENAPDAELYFVANTLRKFWHNDNRVTWIIDRNVNITNVCVSGCKFCNFHCKVNGENAYVTSLEEYREKIRVLFDNGGDQLLLQGGMNPRLDIEYYKRLFRQLKSEFPTLRLHALGPPEVYFLAKKARLNYKETLLQLMEAGLDSLPGAGAEILNDEIRKRIAPGKCLSQPWLDIMHEAHKLKMVTSATMMFGHVEQPKHRIEHLVKIRELQSIKPENSNGFTAFIPWPFMDEGTSLQSEGINSFITAADYVRLVAISRIMLPNIPNIQASWLTVGKETAQLCLHAGANDLGSIMIEENVVSSAGAQHQMNAEGMQKAIKAAGFIPQRRNQAYEYV